MREEQVPHDKAIHALTNWRAPAFTVDDAEAILQIIYWNGLQVVDAEAHSNKLRETSKRCKPYALNTAYAILSVIFIWCFLSWLYSYQINALKTIIIMKDARIDSCEHRGTPR